MTREQYRECFAELKSDYPEAKVIQISYFGEGDSLDSFDLDHIDNKWERDFDTSKYNDLLFTVLDMSEADFNNDGSRGTITIHLQEETITVDNYYRETIEHSTGEIEVNIINIENDVTTQTDDQIIM